jgi:hypothetical protein
MKDYIKIQTRRTMLLEPMLQEPQPETNSQLVIKMLWYLTLPSWQQKLKETNRDIEDKWSNYLQRHQQVH